MKKKDIHSIKKTGFKAPDSYFESLEERILDKIKNENVLDGIEETGLKTPETYFDTFENRVMDALNDGMAFDDIPEPGFKTPAHYFEGLEDSIMSRLDEDHETKVISLLSRRNIMYFSGVAAAIVIMFGIFLNEPSGIDSLDIEVVETYLEQQDLDTYDIASIMTEEDLTNEDFGIINDSFSEESLESLEDYLLDNANLEDILEQ